MYGHRVGDRKTAKWDLKRNVKIFCNNRSEKTSKDLIKDFFLEIRRLASLENMLPRNTALRFFLEVYKRTIEIRRGKKK